MKFFTLIIATFFAFGVFAVKKDNTQEPLKCNIYNKCPLKEQYKNSNLSKKELEKDKYHQCCSYYGHCGESIEYCGLGCQYGDCLKVYKDQTNQYLSCHTLYINNQCSQNCPCLNGACCSKSGYCGTTEEFCGEGNRMTTTSTHPIQIFTIETISTSTSVATPSSKKIVKGMCGENIGKCSENECCSRYGWCGSSRDHCYISKGCQPGFGLCIEDAPTKTSAESDNVTITITHTKQKTKETSAKKDRYIF